MNAILWTRRLHDLGLRLDSADPGQTQLLRRASSLDAMSLSTDGGSSDAAVWALGLLAVLD